MIAGIIAAGFPRNNVDSKALSTVTDVIVWTPKRKVTNEGPAILACTQTLLYFSLFFGEGECEARILADFSFTTRDRWTSKRT